jgi:hypothetical protein
LVSFTTPDFIFPEILIDRSKQIISTQKQYDFLESLTADIALPPSRPSTPPLHTSGSQPRRRRRQSPTATPSIDPPADVPKRKRRSPQKDASQTEENSIQTESPVKSDPDIKSEQGDNPAEDKHRRGGWFDIVMGSNNEESSEDEGAKKRKYVNLPYSDFVTRVNISGGR